VKIPYIKKPTIFWGIPLDSYIPARIWPEYVVFVVLLLLSLLCCCCCLCCVVVVVFIVVFVDIIVDFYRINLSKTKEKEKEETNKKKKQEGWLPPLVVAIALIACPPCRPVGPLSLSSSGRQPSSSSSSRWSPFVAVPWVLLVPFRRSCFVVTVLLLLAWAGWCHIVVVVHM
jgi:hypothetical protein